MSPAVTTCCPSAATIFTIVPCIGVTSESPPRRGALPAAGRGGRRNAEPRARSGRRGTRYRARRPRSGRRAAPPRAACRRPRRSAARARRCLGGRRRSAAVRVSRGELGLDPAGVHVEVIAGERRVVDHGPVERQHGGHAADGELGERAARRAPGPASRLAPVTISLPISESNAWGTVCPAVYPASSRTPGPGRRVPLGDRARRGQEVPRRVLGVDPELDRVPAQLAGRRSRAARPSAMRNISRTRSMPLTSSETGCSTWSLVFTSRKLIVPSVATRNSQVPAPT